jgi:hypothetical protein
MQDALEKQSRSQQLRTELLNQRVKSARQESRKVRPQYGLPYV